MYETRKPFASLPSGPRACTTPVRVTLWPGFWQNIKSRSSIFNLPFSASVSSTLSELVLSHGRPNSPRYQLRHLLRILQILTLRDCVTWRTSSPLSSLQALLKTLSLKLSMDCPRDPPSKISQGLSHGFIRSWRGTSHLWTKLKDFRASFHLSGLEINSGVELLRSK